MTITLTALTVGAVIGVASGITLYDLCAAITRYFWRRYRLPKMREWIETNVLSPDRPIELLDLKYGWRGYEVSLQMEDIDRIAITRQRRLKSPLHLTMYVLGVKGGVFIATEPAPV